MRLCALKSNGTPIPPSFLSQFLSPVTRMTFKLLPPLLQLGARVPVPPYPRSPPITGPLTPTP